MPDVGQERGLTISEREDILRQHFQHGFDLITCKARFYTFSPAVWTDLDIYVHDVGRISLPLSDLQAKELIAKSRQDPCRNGGGTIVDTSLEGNAWEINPDQFQIRSPQWKPHMDGLLQVMAAKLGVRVPISAELYKMLLYEKGAIPKAHTE